MSRTDDLIQICMPVHNGESHIDFSLKSLLCQVHKNIEIIIMDNASTDGTESICRRYAEIDTRIRYFRSDEFVDACENWNRAFSKIDRSRSRFFMWAGDDDLWDANFIRRLLVPLRASENCVLSFSKFGRIDNSGSVVKEGTFYGEDWVSSSPLKAYRWLMKRDGGHCAICGLIRIDAVDWYPAFANTCFGADLWFLIRLASKGSISYTAENLFLKRLGGISSTGEDVSAPKDVNLIWNIGHGEWALIGGLIVSFYAKVYIFLQLKIMAKLLFPIKKVDFYLWPWFAVKMLHRNPRGLGLRSKMRLRRSRQASPSHLSIKK